MLTILYQPSSGWRPFRSNTSGCSRTTWLIASSTTDRWVERSRPQVISTLWGSAQPFLGG